MLNHIVIMGRLTRDPELRKTQSGSCWWVWRMTASYIWA